MLRLVRLLTPLLALTLLAANSASAVTAPLAEKPASGLFGSLEQRAEVDALASSGHINEKSVLLYDFASDFSVAARGATSVADDAARALVGREPNRIFSARALVRQAEEPGPFHNFPGSFDEQIFQQGQRLTVSEDYVQYTLRGTVNGRTGTFEIGVRPSASGRTEVITHRFFRPDPSP